MERKQQIIVTILVLCQTTNTDIEPCADSMWTEGVVRDCYTEHAEKAEGLACLSLRMTLEKLYVLASYCQCQPSEAGRTLEKFDGPLVTKLGNFRSECKGPLQPIRRNQNFVEARERRQT